MHVGVEDLHLLGDGSLYRCTVSIQARNHISAGEVSVIVGDVLVQRSVQEPSPQPRGDSCTCMHACALIQN